jgi:hypothetical protein
MLTPLLFITNPKNSDPDEDIFLADYLKKYFNITVADPMGAVDLLPNFSFCLIRNAWPSRLFLDELKAIKKISDENRIKVYNPFHRGGIEDKSYLIDLFRGGFPVIPTIDQFDDLNQLPRSEIYVVKPKDGCSSFGVKFLSLSELRHEDITGSVIQPAIDLRDEISLYSIDNVFSYAMVSAGPGKRWDLMEHEPSEEEMDWAMKFIKWNNMPYGLQRIDGCRTKAGDVLLMEVEDFMPMLCLADLSDSTRDRVLNQLVVSLQKKFL